MKVLRMPEHLEQMALSSPYRLMKVQRMWSSNPCPTKTK